MFTCVTHNMCNAMDDDEDLKEKRLVVAEQARLKDL